MKKLNFRSVKLKVSVIGLLVLPCISAWVLADAFSLSQYLDYLKGNDPAYKLLALDEQEVLFLLDSKIEGEALQLDLQTEKGFGDDDVDSESLSASLSKSILDTGTDFSLSHSRNENPDRDESLSQVKVEQSLLKNAFGKDARLQKKILSKQERLEALKALEAYEIYLSEKILLYIEYAQAQNEVVFLEALVNKSRSLHGYIRERRKKNAASEIDEMRVRLQLVQREQDLFNSKESVKIQQEKLLVGSGIFLDKEGNDLKAEAVLDLRKLFSGSTDIFDYKKLRVFEMVALDNEIKRSEYKIAKDDHLPDLSIYGAYKVDDSTRFTSSVNRKESAVGIKLSMPIGDKQSKAKKSISALNVQYSNLEQQVYMETLTSSYDEQKLRLAKSEAQLSLAKEKLKLIKGILEEETLRYRRGQLDIDRIIDTNNELHQYQLELNQNRLAFNRIYLDWLVFNDLLVKNNISH